MFMQSPSAHLSHQRACLRTHHQAHSPAELPARPFQPGKLQRLGLSASQGGRRDQRHSGCCLATSRGDDGGPGGSGGGGGGGRNIGKPSVGGGDDDNHDGEQDDEELLSPEQAEALAAAKGIQLPADFVEAARSGGLRAGALASYATLQGSWLAGLLARRTPFIRDRLLVDPRFLFKIFAEIAIDTGCATVAEVRKRGEDFWAEFEFYLSDLVVGCVLNCVLVSLMAPTATLGAQRTHAGASGEDFWGEFELYLSDLLVGCVLDFVLVALMAPTAVLGASKARAASSGLQRALTRVPSAVFAPSPPGQARYTPLNRAACVGVKFAEYSLAGISCGFVGQAAANSLMLLKRRMYGKQEGDVEVPPLVKSALTWGLFMGVSSNLRYQAVFGIEQVVDSTVGRRVPAVAYGTTLAVRFVNNVIGGENFIDMARWAGIQ